MIALILKISLCWLFFYGIYELFLKNRTFFTVNRSYLLITLAIGILLPFLEYIPWKNETNVAHVIYPVLMEIDGLQTVAIEKAPETFNWFNVIYFIYAVGVILNLIRFSLGINKILQLYRSSEKQKRNGFVMVLTDQPHLPFSFFNWVFFSKKVTLSEEVDRILLHEIEHIKGRHSLDIIATEILKILFWCSPMIYLYKNALKEVHEFLADQVVIKKSDISTYKKLLLNQTKSSLQMELTHQFFNSHLKNRIKMINQKRSGRPTLVMYALGIPVLLFLMLAFTYSLKDVVVNDSEVPELIEKIGDYYMETDPSKVPYFQINGEDIDLPLYKHISLYSNIGNPVVLLPDEAIKKFGEKAKLGYINFENPHLKNEKEYWISMDPKLYRKTLGNIMIAEREVRKENNIKSVERDFTPSAGKKMKAALLAGITDKLPPINKPTTGFSGGLETNFDEIARFPTCESMGLDKDEVQSCAMKQMIKTVQEHLEYPEKARLNGVYGNVYISFVVTETGQTEDFRIRSDIGGNCGQAALEACKNLANYTWIPAQKDGKAVNMRYILPVSFDLTPEGAEAYKELEVKLDTVPKTKNVVSNQAEEMEIFKVVEEMPRFPGCETNGLEGKEIENCAKQKMLEYIYTNLKYPKEDREAGVEGMSVVQFVVTKDGGVTNLKVVRSLSELSDKEVLRVVEGMNKMEARWRPGYQRGYPVNVQYTLPVRFKLEGEKPVKKDSEGNSEVKVKGQSTLEQITVTALGNKKTEQNDVGNATHFLNGEALNNVCYIIDGEIAKSNEQKQINNEDIATINVYKAKEIIYDRFKLTDYDAVVEILTKEFAASQQTPDLKSLNGAIKNPRLDLNLPGLESDPLYVIDGKVVTKENGSNVDPDQVVNVHVIKGNTALAKYGKDGIHGVVEITTKDRAPVAVEYQYDTPAYFPGCEGEMSLEEKKKCSNQSLMNYVYGHLKYPKEARDKGIEGLVVTSFIVDADGEIRDIKLPKYVDGLSNSALQVVAEMADSKIWEPATKDGKKVAMEIVLPINFKIYDKESKEVEPVYTQCNDLKDDKEKEECIETNRAIVKKALENLQVDDRSLPALSLQDIRIFPNPAKEAVNISFKGEAAPLTVQLVSLDGKVIYNQTLNSFSGSFNKDIDLSNVDANMVLVIIKQRDRIHTEKIILE